MSAVKMNILSPIRATSPRYSEHMTSSSRFSETTPSSQSSEATVEETDLAGKSCEIKSEPLSFSPIESSTTVSFTSPSHQAQQSRGALHLNIVSPKPRLQSPRLQSPRGNRTNGPTPVKNPLLSPVNNPVLSATLNQGVSNGQLLMPAHQGLSSMAYPSGYQAHPMMSPNGSVPLTSPQHYTTAQHIHQSPYKTDFMSSPSKSGFQTIKFEDNHQPFQQFQPVYQIYNTQGNQVYYQPNNSYMKMLETPTDFDSTAQSYSNSPASIDDARGTPTNNVASGRVYKPCVVCGDKSSGYHYSVSSCEGCKGFFRRSVQKQITYTCHKDQNCPVNKVTRNRCQFCRLKKCTAMGMSKEAVRSDRTKLNLNKRKSDTTASAASTSLSASPASSESPPTAAMIASLPMTSSVVHPEPGLLERVVNAFTEHFVEPNNNNNASTIDSKPAMIDPFWSTATELDTAGVLRVVKFSKKIPGFNTLSTNDKVILLRAACLEIMIINISRKYDVAIDRLVLAPGLFISRQDLETRAYLGPALAEQMFQLASCLRSMSVDITEISLLTAICLITTDRAGLENSEAIGRLQEPLLECLKQHVIARRPEQPVTFAKIIMKLTDIRSISQRGAEKLLQARADNRAIPALITEMLDRSESAAAAQQGGSA